MRPSHGALAAVAALLLAGCGSDAGGPARWEGPPPPSAEGRIDVSGFNGFLARERPAPARSPLLLAAEFLRLDRLSRAATTSLVSRLGGEGDTPATVIVTLDGLFDDSVRAERYVLRLDLQEDGTWRLRSAVWGQRCLPGRGHQAFSPALCV